RLPVPSWRSPQAESTPAPSTPTAPSGAGGPIAPASSATAPPLTGTSRCRKAPTPATGRPSPAASPPPGRSSTAGSVFPVQETTDARDWAAVSAGQAHTCAVKTSGTLWCWGYNSNGQLGDAGTVDSAVPVQESTHASDWDAVTARYAYTCAVKTAGTLWCWGSNSSGQLGDGTTTGSAVPVQESTHASDWASVSVGFLHTCAIKTAGTLWCEGSNSSGQLGDSTTTGSAVPVQESTHASDWASVTVAFADTCAVKTSGTLWCWGYNSNGQLGDGTTTDSYVPVQVTG